MTGEAYKYIKEGAENFTKNFLNGLFGVSRPNTSDSEVITFLNQELTRGRLSNGMEVTTIPIGQPNPDQDLGFKISEGVYAVYRKPTKMIFSDNPAKKKPWFIIGMYSDGNTVLQSGSSPPGFPEFNVVNGSSLAQFRIPKESLTTLYSTDGSSGFDGIWKVGISPDLKNIALVRVLYNFTQSIYIADPHRVVLNQVAPTVYYAVLSGVSFNSNTGLVDWQSKVEGTHIYSYGGPTARPASGAQTPPQNINDTQGAYIVIGYDNSNNPIIDLIGFANSSYRFRRTPDNVLIFDFQSAAWSVTDIAGANSLTFSSAGPEAQIDVGTFANSGGSSGRGLCIFQNHGNVSSGQQSGGQGVRLNTNLAAQGINFPQGDPLASPNAGLYLNPYTTVSVSSPGVYSNNFIIDDTAGYTSYNSVTNWSTSGNPLKTTATKSFLELQTAVDGSGNSTYTLLPWTYDSVHDTMVSGKSAISGAFSSSYNTVVESGTYSGYHIMDWLVK